MTCFGATAIHTGQDSALLSLSRLRIFSSSHNAGTSSSPLTHSPDFTSATPTSRALVICRHVAQGHHHPIHAGRAWLRESVSCRWWTWWCRAATSSRLSECCHLSSYPTYGLTTNVYIWPLRMLLTSMLSVVSQASHARMQSSTRFTFPAIG